MPQKFDSGLRPALRMTRERGNETPARLLRAGERLFKGQFNHISVQNLIDGSSVALGKYQDLLEVFGPKGS